MALKSSSSLPQFSGFPSVSSSFPSAPPVASGLCHLPGASAVPIVPAAPAVPAPRPLFRPFAALLPSSAPSAPGPSSFSQFPLHVPQGSAPSASFAYGSASDELLEDDSPDTFPRDTDPSLPQVVPESMWWEFRRILSFIVDLFP